MPRRKGRRLRAAALALLPSLLPPSGGPARGEGAGRPAEAYGLRGVPEPFPADAAVAPGATGRPPAPSGTDRAKLKAALIDAAAKVAAAEAAIAVAQARLDALTADEAAKRAALAGREAVVAELLAALQRMGRKPPPALLADPGDVLRAARASMLLGAVLPGMRAGVERLLGDLAALAGTRRDLQATRRGLDAELAADGRERDRLEALVAARQDAFAAADGSTPAERAAERDKAERIAAGAASFKDLLGRLEHDSAPAAKGAEAAREAGAAQDAAPPPDGGAAPGAAPPRDPARLAPAVAFNATRGLLPLPVSGALLRRFGEDDGLGGTEKGALFATGRSAVVASPADGWIAYAGPYRSYGQLVILNAGGGYYIVLAGMERINVDLGQFVLTGEPIATMGDGSSKTAVAIALGAAQPVLYVEFRKDGATIDPGPWWAKPEIQKVRG